jgi:methyl-accepting chemotaxis protein
VSISIYPMNRPSIQLQRNATGDSRTLRARAAIIFRAATLGLFLVVAWFVSSTMFEPDATTRERLAPFVVALICWATIVLALIALERLVERRVARPAVRLAELAETVAGGDLTVTVEPPGTGDEVDRLARAVRSMVDNLANMAAALREAARETNSMAFEITSSSREMSSSAGEIASTAGDLSTQSGTMAEGIKSLATSAEELVAFAGSLDSGAREGVERNARLRELAVENRARLEESSTALEALSGDVEKNAAAAEGLAAASEEVRSFVSLVHRLARQSKLLSLNAAMEAARAGEHGSGFAVVADEVRRLAAMSTDAAEKTATVVAGILQAVEQSRASSARAVGTVQEVRAATRQGSASFGSIESAVHDMESWVSAVELTATSMNSLVGVMTNRLDDLARGTESFAAAMGQVAASSQQQSASTEEIVSAASTLSASAERLSKLLANLRTTDRRATMRIFTPAMGIPVPTDQLARNTRSSTSSMTSRPASV